MGDNKFADQNKNSEERKAGENPGKTEPAVEPTKENTTTSEPSTSEPKK